MPSLGLVSYGLAAAGFCLLTLLLAISWEGRAQGMRLVAACGVTTLWAATLALQSRLPAPLVPLAEFLRYGAWFVVLTGLTRSTGIAAWLSRAVHVAWISSMVGVLALPVLGNAGLPVPQPTGLLAGVGLLLALMGLVLLEQMYRNAGEGGRDAFKFLVIATGLMFAYDLFLYSQARLLQGIEPASWNARGMVTVLMVPLIAIAARRNPQWSLNVFVSRHVVFYTTTVMVVGVYLLLMAAGGYWIRFYGGAWGQVAQLVFVVGAGVVLLALLASGTLRRRLRVLIEKHFYRNKYDYRVEWLRFVRTLSAPEAGLDVRENALRAMAQVVNSPGGILYLRTEDDEAFRPAASWPIDAFDARRTPPLPPIDAVAAFLAKHQWVIDLEELRETPDAYENLPQAEPVQDESGRAENRYRLVVPLTHVDDLIGFAVLADPPGRFKPNFEDRDLLKTLGRHVAVHLAQYDADRLLAESRQFETYHRLTAFVMHDLRNLTAQLALIVANAEKHRRNPEFVDDAIGTIANSTERMQRLIDQLQRREVQSPSRRFSLNEAARRACERSRSRKPAPDCELAADDVWVEGDPERLTMMVEHVIRNAQDATPENGSVRVRVAVDGGPGSEASAPVGDTSRVRGPVASVTVADTGTGMSRDFISERLFKPFDSTKGSKGMGIGAYQVREYVRALGGRVDVESEVGKGTRITLRIPLTV